MRLRSCHVAAKDLHAHCSGLVPQEVTLIEVHSIISWDRQMPTTILYMPRKSLECGISFWGQARKHKLQGFLTRGSKTLEPYFLGSWGKCPSMWEWILSCGTLHKLNQKSNSSTHWNTPCSKIFIDCLCLSSSSSRWQVECIAVRNRDLLPILEPY